MVLEDPEKAVKMEIERAPLEVFSPINGEHGQPVVYTKSQPIRSPHELGEVDPRSVKVKIADLGVGESFPQLLYGMDS